jgi:hypothetical protein
MRGGYPIRVVRRRGLGAPVLPDNLITAAGISESFSPGTPDAIIMNVLQTQGQQLPADLAAKWAAAQGDLTTTPQPAPAIQPVILPPVAVTASGSPVSTQTGAAITLMNTIAVAPGVWKCIMSDGSSHYCDVNQNPISYTPPATPVTTPASSQPASTVSTAVNPVAVTPSGTPISTTTGAPASGTVIASVQGELDSLMTWLEGSMIGGIPNWLLVGGVVAGLMMFGGDGGGSSRRRR